MSQHDERELIKSIRDHTPKVRRGLYPESSLRDRQIWDLCNLADLAADCLAKLEADAR